MKASSVSIELRHLRHFVAVAEELHFARAAQRLGIEQSPLSHSIRNLEAELGTKLLQRTTRRTWMTRSGSRFYREAQRILRDVDAAMAAARRNDVDEPEIVRLALGEDLASEPFYPDCYLNLSTTIRALTSRFESCSTRRRRVLCGTGVPTWRLR